MGADVDVDVVVIGGGGCGMVAALRAARGGLTVAVFEKSTQHGCNTQVSSGSLAAAAPAGSAPPASRTPWRGRSTTSCARAATSPGALSSRRCAPWRRSTSSGWPTSSGTRSSSATTCAGTACRCRACTPTPGARAGCGSCARCARRSRSTTRIAFVDGTPGTGLLVDDGARRRRRRASRTACRRGARRTGAALERRLRGGRGAGARVVPRGRRRRLPGRLDVDRRRSGVGHGARRGDPQHGLVPRPGHGRAGHATRINPALPFGARCSWGSTAGVRRRARARLLLARRRPARPLPDRRAVLVWDEEPARRRDALGAHARVPAGRRLPPLCRRVVARRRVRRRRGRAGRDARRLRRGRRA
jgi:fumarate reductase flavoprotein subunit